MNCELIDMHVKISDNPDVESAFEAYPEEIRVRLASLRKLILEVAATRADIDGLEETLKWGEPSYLTSGGSTVRIGWKKSRPDNYAMYFNCNTKLVDTFRELYADSFEFEGNRAIVFHRNDTVPTSALKHCIELALRYHKIKHLPLLGA